MPAAALDHAGDGLDHLGVVELAGDAQGDAEIGRPDHNDVHARDREQVVAAFESGLGLDLEHHQNVVVHVLDDLVEAGLLVADLGNGEPVATDASGRKLGPGNGPLQQLGVLHAGEDDALRPHVEGTGHQRVLQVADPDDGGERGEQGGADDVLDGLQVVIAVLGVDEGPVQAGGGVETGNFGRAELAQAGPPHRLALLEQLLDTIWAHKERHCTTLAFPAAQA